MPLVLNLCEECKQSVSNKCQSHLWKNWDYLTHKITSETELILGCVKTSWSSSDDRGTDVAVLYIKVKRKCPT